MSSRYNEGTLEALSSPSRCRTYIDFTSEIILDPTSREIWIYGDGNVEWQPTGNDSMILFAPDNAGAGNIFITAKQIAKIGTATTVSRIDVWD